MTPGDLLRLEPEELPDAVILVDDEVADAQVGERRKRTAEPGVGARRPLAEDLRVGQEDEPELAPDEPAARRRDGEAERRIARKRGAVRVDRALDLAQQPALSLRLAAMRERDDDPIARSARIPPARSRPRPGPAPRSPAVAPRTETPARAGTGRAR